MGRHTLVQTIVSVQLTCIHGLRQESLAMMVIAILTIGVNFLYDLLYFCLSGVEVECAQYISDLVRVNFSISTFVKQGKCIPVFCVCVCVCVGERQFTSLHILHN